MASRLALGGKCALEESAQERVECGHSDRYSEIIEATRTVQAVNEGLLDRRLFVFSSCDIMACKTD